MGTVRVSDVMTKRIVYLPSETPLDEAARAMAEADIGDVVVTEGANLAGMATDRDIVVRAVATNRKPSAVTLGEVAVREIVIIEQSATLKEAADLMRQRAVRRVLVADADRQLVGIIAMGDLAVIHETAVSVQRN
ncbi:CBS domain protein [Asanoa ferruginea]|uniref:CBS domain protein n=1 Tax=Asanoa ferruginea TaxID=53367 RepID=A0A3D9ZGI6_9ACTN|nr:CBS domain-containing protein [Asanoa ferruginea]REF96385.1 CBS domain protein [Asanoa ferruginea]GIF47031.1 oxidoreductase [Asanoa ferruginea]